MPRLSIAREISYDTLVRVMGQQQDPDEVLDSLYEKYGSKLKRIDRNLAKEIVFGTLRWWKKMYWILQNISKRDLDKSSMEVKVALCAGTYQIFYLYRIPDRASVNESAEYMRKRKQVSAVSFVNGILRQIAKKAQYFPKPDKDQYPVEYLALQFSHPEWLVNRWSARFKFDRLSEMLANSNQPPPYSIRMNSVLTEFEKQSEFQTLLLKEEKTHSQKRPLRGAIRLKESPNLGEESLFSKGFFTVQDEASQLIAPLVAPKPGELIIDACSGPGGKLTHMVELADGAKNDNTANKDTAFISIEKDQAQFEKVRQNIERLNIKKVELVHCDFLEFSPQGTPDKILIDAPCSGLGVLRRHPEGKWHKDEDIVSRMASKQKDILKHAWDMLAPGGEIIFSVCSFEPEETTEQLKWLINRFDDKIEVVDPSERLQDFYKKYVTRDQVLIVYAGNQDLMDGFGAFIVKKKA